MKIVIEDTFLPDHVCEEDGGSAMIWSSASYPPESEDDDDLTPGVFFRFQSWDPESQKHDLFRQFVGKKVRITIESLDVLDQLSEIE